MLVTLDDILPILKSFGTVLAKQVALFGLISLFECFKNLLADKVVHVRCIVTPLAVTTPNLQRRERDRIAYKADSP